MTHQNHQTNGASLEDCHTNFFALTELYGIKWRKLVWGEGGGGEAEEGGAPLTDPVISSYARCLAGDILCVWRRVPAPQSQDIYETSSPAPPPLSLRAAKELWIFWYGEEPDLNGLVAPELIATASQSGDQGSWESGLSYECRSLLFKALHNLIERCLLSRDFVRLGKWFVQPYDGDEEDVGKSPWHLSFSFAFFLHGESTVCASVDVRQHPPVRTLTPKRLARINSPEHQANAKVILAPFGLEGTLTGREWSEADPPTARMLDSWRQLYPLEQGAGAVEVVCDAARMRYPQPYVLVTEMEARAAPPAPPAPPALAHAALQALTTPAPHRTVELCYADVAGDKTEDFVDPTRKTPCTCAKWRRRRAARAPPFHRRPAAASRAPPPPPPSPPHPTRARAARRADNLSCGGGGGGGCSPGSCGGGSPAAAVSAPSSAGAAPPSPAPHPHPHAHAHHATHTPIQNQSASAVPTTLHTPAPTPDPLAPPTPAPPSLPPPKHNQADSPPGSLCGVELARRPVLPSAVKRLDPMEDEHSLHMLYDYTTVHAWLEHPVKRFKPTEACYREEPAPAPDADLYAGHEHTRMPHHRADLKHEKHEHDDSKEYKNLFTSDGLCPTLKDLDQIFETSDEAGSGDETVRLLQVQTPPDSNKSGEEARCRVRAEELSKMFPTPPSMEAHAQPSPGFTLPDDRLLPTHHYATAALLAPAQPDHGSPAPAPDHPIEDWSYVFKPPTVCKYVGSSKYAPLGNLPSQLLPAVSLPPHAVYRPRAREPPRPRTPAPTTPAPATPGPAPGSVPLSAPASNDPARNGIKRSGSPLESRTLPRRTESRARRSPGGCGRSPLTPAPPPPPPPPLPPPPPRARPACPLLLNVLLADTVLNVFRDHNFDSCTLCVCNAGPKVVGNIRGADAFTYLPRAGAEGGAEGGAGWGEAGADEEPPRCTCGFSAVVNRRRAHRAGLFYEDEMEITGLAEEPGGGGCAGGGLGDVAGLVVGQCAGAGGGDASALARAARRAADHAPHDELHLNLLEYSDGGAAAARALRAAGGGGGGGGGTTTSSPGAVHRWPFIGARAPRSSRDVVRLMRRLRPLLQDAIQKRCCGARMWDGVTGPLTWRQFHRLAGRGNEDLCEPQPVPPLLVGHERDWLALAPYALRHWERLQLEPYAYPRDVAYAVLAPATDALQDPIRAFFRELSAAYEACRLGRHRPLRRVGRDGILRASPSNNNSGDDEWTGPLPSGRASAYLRGYVEALRSSLVPALAGLTVDRTLFEGERADTLRAPAAASEPGAPHDENEGGITAPHNPPAWLEEDESGAPALVIYVVEPPAAHADRAHTLHALLRIATRTQQHLHHQNPLIKIISLESVCEQWGVGWGVGSEDGVPEGSGGAGSGGAGGAARALAFSVFAGARRRLQHAPDGKSLTGFGTAANANLFLRNKDEKNRAPYALFSPAWVLSAAAPGGTGPRDAEGWAQAGEQGAVLFLAYCLSHDQRWLLAAATDARGELLDTAAINIHVPHRSRRRRSGPARRLGLTKLMDFTLGVMSQAAQPWRLVVGRVGRIGHGELKGWSWLLSRKHLSLASGTLRELCGACTAGGLGAAPCILSACLVATEPEPALRLMADRFTPDERFSQHALHSALHTPRDVTATHILVFPTSATTQSNQMPFEPPMANGEDNDMMFLNVDMGDEDMGDDQMTDIFSADMFNSMFAQTSPSRRLDDDAAGEEAPAHASASAHKLRADSDAHENVGTVLQQPLALGYLVSTAPLGGMPAWWWAGCAHLRGACPAFLRSALHLHAGSLQQADDFTSLLQRRDHNAHPLDSQLTTDVLRYVLEGYNALSWLALDGNTADRVSCLPLHVQVLMQLYHTAAALG